jgi:hypothetical protein
MSSQALMPIAADQAVPTFVHSGAGTGLAVARLHPVVL